MTSWSQPSWNRLKPGDRVMVEWYRKDAWYQPVDQQTYHVFGEVASVHGHEAVLSLEVDGEKRDLSVDSVKQFKVAKGKTEARKAEII